MADAASRVSGDPVSVVDEPDYWYVTEAEGMKFFRDERQLTVATWCAGAPRHKLETLTGDLLDHFEIPLAPIKTVAQ